MSKFLFQDTLPGGGVSPLDISTPPPTKGQRSKRPQPRRLGTRAASLMPPTKAPARRQDPEEEGEEELDEESGEDASEEDDYVELDLERTLTWTGNAVIVQAGGEFRMPLIVPHPSVLAIQFEVDNGNDIEFSLMFKDDNEDDASMLVEPVRVTDREGQLDIDTTGVCEIIWSNGYAWLSSKTLSYQLQLAPKIDLLKKKWRAAVISASLTPTPAATPTPTRCPYPLPPAHTATPAPCLCPCPSLNPNPNPNLNPDPDPDPNPNPDPTPRSSRRRLTSES